MRPVLRPLIQEVVQLFQFDEQMLGRANFRHRSGQRALRILQIGRRVGGTADAAVVARLVFRSAFWTRASDKSIGQKRSGDGIVKLCDVFRL